MPKEDLSSDRSHQGLPQGGVELSLDELAKELATGTLSRGKAIRWMGGALLGAALASVPGVAWANDCRRLGRECRRDSQCCSNNCVRRGDDNKVCACPEGKSRCNDRCVNLDRNENHCGECFNRCEEGVECVDGVCGGGEPICNPPCPEGEVCVQSPQPGTLPFCDPICTPSCPEGCDCERSGDGSGNVCTGFVGGPVPNVSSCDQCPHPDFPEFTVCVNISSIPGGRFLICKPPC
jgi:Stigma-specific protein, Stig1